MHENNQTKRRESVPDQAEGKWLEIFNAIAPDLRPAIHAFLTTGKHTACPVHGGKDGFRFFKDVPQRGAGVCNTCGSFSSGARLAAWLNKNGKLEASPQYQPPQRRQGEDDDSYNIRDAYKKIAHYLNHGHDLYPALSLERLDMSGAPSENRISEEEKNRRARERAQQQWEAAGQDDNSHILAAYFRQRGLQVDNLPQNIRVGEKIPYFNKGEPISYHYCILAPLALTTFNPNEKKYGRKFLAMHRIYLDPVPFAYHPPEDPSAGVGADMLPTSLSDTQRLTAPLLFKKAEVETPKKTSDWGNYTGASVLLYPPYAPFIDTREVLFVGEGIETMTAFASLCPLKAPVYATLVAGALATFEIPDDLKAELKTIVVAADYDIKGAGMNAFDKLKAKLATEYPHISVVAANPEPLHLLCRSAAAAAVQASRNEEERIYPKGIDWDAVAAACSFFDNPAFGLAELADSIIKNAVARSPAAHLFNEAYERKARGISPGESTRLRTLSGWEPDK